MLLDYQENGSFTAQLRFNRKKRLNFLTIRPKVISILPAFAKEREAVEHFIMDVYAASYGARIDIHYPTLMSIQDEAGTILAAAGFRYAAEETLFLEQYLTAPVEQILNTPRNRIVEIGNMASGGGGASSFLFAALSAYLNHRSFTDAVITGTDFIEKRLRSLGLRPRRLAAADPALLRDNGENWGRYYDTNPHVLAGSIGKGYQKLQRTLGAEYTENALRLIPRLHHREE